MSFDEIIKERGSAAEYHVNSTLNKKLRAIRYHPEKKGNEYYLFDGIVLPYRNSLTEVDHLLVCRKGIFSLETKSIKGKVFGEMKSNKWYSANAIGAGKLYDRGFQNPFRQNIKHIKAIKQALRRKKIEQTVFNVVLLIDADGNAWAEGQWGGEPTPNLFLSAHELVENLKDAPNKLSQKQVDFFANVFFQYYSQREVLREKFMSQIKEVQKKYA